MREPQQRYSIKEERAHITTPVRIAVTAVLILAGILIWFGIKKPVIFHNVSDLVITLTALLLFLIAVIISVICIILSSRIKEARGELDRVLSEADGKVESLGDRVTEVMKSILQPFMEIETSVAGVKHLFSKNKQEN